MSDFHADMNDGAMRRLEEILVGLKYDLCVLTGDYRGATFGNFEDALALIRRILARIERPVCTENSIRIDWGGNHVTSAHNDRAVMVLANVVRFAVEVEEPS
jgi:hypothetical protein